MIQTYAGWENVFLWQNQGIGSKANTRYVISRNEYWYGLM